ncbi:hypothetical protein [Campylobacter troglodytis]|uniref:hypothetical protein n=1 Tax=Campylobacter troglodytis TaxID=654363 RepID=UPI00115B1793|nr:hypothetical protein [Campylobacter troglodytis]TQR58559.1 hypothetical protein DMC01_07835 [Campylobacter troglodytis]
MKTENGNSRQSMNLWIFLLRLTPCNPLCRYAQYDKILGFCLNVRFLLRKTPKPPPHDSGLSNVSMNFTQKFIKNA